MRFGTSVLSKAFFVFRNNIEFAPVDSKMPISYYSHNIVGRNGRGKTYIPLAMNEKPGKYTVSAVDVLTGTKTWKTIEVFKK